MSRCGGADPPDRGPFRRYARAPAPRRRPAARILDRVAPSLPRPPGCRWVLAGLLDEYRGRSDVIVLGLPRGAPVADEVATALGAPLDVFVVRKLGVPGREERRWAPSPRRGDGDQPTTWPAAASPEVIGQVPEREGRELLRREQAYREGRPFTEVTGKVATWWMMAGRLERARRGGGVVPQAGEKESCSASAPRRGPPMRSVGAPAAGDRGDLPARDRTPQPLLPGPCSGPVRRADPHR